MKTGFIMVLSALSLYVGTLFWAAFKEIPREVYRFHINDLKKANQAPDRVTADSYFYASEKSTDITISVPVPVELDNSFNGIELKGDTSMFRHLWVATPHQPGKYGGMYVGYRSIESGDTTASALNKTEVAEILRRSNVSIRVGIGSSKMPGPSTRRFSFNCAKLSSINFIDDPNLIIHLISIDSVSLQLDVDKLTFTFYEKLATSNNWVHLEGNCKRAFIKFFDSGTLDANYLKVKDFYIDACKDSRIHVYASDLARIRQVDNCEVEIEGNPRYKRVEMKE